MTNRTAKMTWRTRYATNIPSIDAHHQGLFKILRMLEEAAQKGQTHAEMDAILAFLEKYTRVHFEGEDAFMQRSGFPLAEVHSREHARLTSQLKQLKERFSSASSGAAKAPGDLLLAWCAQPGVADARDRQRCERVVAALERPR